MLEQIKLESLKLAEETILEPLGEFQFMEEIEKRLGGIKLSEKQEEFIFNLDPYDVVQEQIDDAADAGPYGYIS